MVNSEQIGRALVEFGLAENGETITLEPLGGGVSCDVFKVALRGGTVCVKQALPKLRVEADWRVSPDRAHVEAMWLEEAHRIGVPAPRLLFERREAHFFVMSFLPESSHAVWKSRLARGEADPVFASSVGSTLAKMHNETAGSETLSHKFDNAELFEALRIDPFILHCARQHAAVSDQLVAIADRTRETRQALIHGDFSPKNILCGPNGPVILDAECATYGDPAFDLAFCTTHLLLKSIWQFQAFDPLVGDAEMLIASYLESSHGPGAIAARVGDLIAAQMLARVDGKSPVEYLDAAAQQKVRHTALDWLRDPPRSPQHLVADWVRRKEPV